MESLYPFESRYLDLDGNRYHYLDEGSGEVLLMVHGNPTWSFYYRNLILNLRSGYRVVVPDHVGCGYSDKPLKYSYTLQQHIDNLTALIRTLDLKNITLLMHDWGGPISMGYAVDHPNNVKDIILFNTAAFWLPELPLSLRLLQKPLLGSLLVKQLNLFVWSGILIGSRKTMRQDVRSGYLKPYNSFKNRVGVLEFIRDIPMSKKHPSFGTLKSIEDKLHILLYHRLLIIWGRRDPVFTEAFLDEWRRRFPQAVIKVIEEAGHYVVEDGIDEIVPYVNNFLNADVGDLSMDSRISNIE